MPDAMSCCWPHAFHVRRSRRPPTLKYPHFSGPPCVQVDFVAISFVRDRNVIDNVRSYIESQLKRHGTDHRISVVAKMEAYESIGAMGELVDASDAIMVARSDLGAQIPMEDVPAVQREIVFRCRQVHYAASS
jgi:pyruvate kinase